MCYVQAQILSLAAAARFAAHVSLTESAEKFQLPVSVLTSAGPTTPIPGLYMTGDSTFPGIGLPAVAASGTIAANTLAPVWDHWKLLDEIGL